MKITPTRIPDVCTVDPVFHGDARGYFMETWRVDLFEQSGIAAAFAQDAMSRSLRGVLRGLHYQIPRAQGKLVRVVQGAIFDVAVDLRRSSPTFGQWVGERLAEDNRRALWIPPGFAHGFYVERDAVILYKLTEIRVPSDERSIRWDDPTLAIDWPIHSDADLLLSEKDSAGARFETAELFA